VSELAVQKLARLEAIVAERATWNEQLARLKRMHGWVRDAEHILDGSWAHEGEEVSNATLGSRLDGWREQLAQQLTEGTLCELERECLSEFVRVLSKLRPQLVQCYDRKDFPRTNNAMERSIRGRKHTVSPDQWSQELERLSVALWALCGLHGLVAARCGPSPAPGAARRTA
jgi:Transposase IS66 family